MSRRKQRSGYSPNLVDQMAICDSNYARLEGLLREIAARGDDAVEYGFADGREGSGVLRLEVIERCPYTTTVRLVTRLGADITAIDPLAALAGLRQTVRLYHDLRTAEVVTVERHRNLRAAYEYPNDAMHQPNEKAQVNQFLGELLAHCMRTGHSRDIVAAAPKP